MLVLLAGVAPLLPNLVKPRVTGAHQVCPANLKQIDGAVLQWARDNKKAATDTYSLSDPTLLAYIKGSVLPVCPGGGRYLSGLKVGDNPKCSLGRLYGHTL